MELHRKHPVLCYSRSTHGSNPTNIIIMWTNQSTQGDFEEVLSRDGLQRHQMGHVAPKAEWYIIHMPKSDHHSLLWHTWATICIKYPLFLLCTYQLSYWTRAWHIADPVAKVDCCTVIECSISPTLMMARIGNLVFQFRRFSFSKTILFLSHSHSTGGNKPRRQIK
jgi:hypothetical protein